MEMYVDDEAKLTLHGLQQHYVKLKDSEKNRKLFELLDVLEFNQVVIFVKSVQRCVALAQLLIEQNFPAIAIHRGMSQEERLSRYQQFKDFQKVSSTANFRESGDILLVQELQLPIVAKIDPCLKVFDRLVV